MAQFSSDKLDDQIEILKKRTGQRWTIRDIAKATGVSSAYLTFLKNGHRRNPSGEIVKKLSELFQIRPEDLLETEDESAGTTKPSQPDVSQPLTRQTLQTLQFCQQLLESGHPEQVIQFLSLLEETAGGAQDPLDIQMEKKLTKAHAFLQLGRLETAVALLDECLEETLSEALVTKASLLRGHVLARQGQVAEAIREYREALERAEQERNLELALQLHEALGRRCKSVGEYGLAIYHIEQTLRHVPEGEDLRKKAELYLELGQIHLHVLSFTAAAQAFAAAEEVNDKVGDPVLQGDLPYWIAKAEFCQRQYERAAELLQTSLQVRQAGGDHAGVAACLLDLAACYQKVHDWEAVESCAQRAAISFENMNEMGLVARAKLLFVEARHHLRADPQELLDMIEPICEVLARLDRRFDLAVAFGIRADICRHLGEHEAALTASMKALDIYQSCVGERLYSH